MLTDGQKVRRIWFHFSTTDASEALWFQNGARYRKSKTCTGSTCDWPVYWVRHFAYPSLIFTGDQKLRNLASVFDHICHSFKTAQRIWNLKQSLGTPMMVLCFPKIWCSAVRPSLRNGATISPLKRGQENVLNQRLVLAWNINPDTSPIPLLIFTGGGDWKIPKFGPDFRPQSFLTCMRLEIEL